MAKQYQNDKRFLVIQMSWREWVAISETWGLCDCCGGQDFDTGGYYVAVVDSWYCKKCFDSYYAGATHYKVDLNKERDNFNKVVNNLKRLGTWENE